MKAPHPLLSDGSMHGMQIITPFNVYFNTKLIMQGQVWRLLTNFFFFGNLGKWVSGGRGAMARVVVMAVG